MVRNLNFEQVSISLLLLMGCGNGGERTSFKNYEIVKEENLETSNKAQLIEYAVFKDIDYTQSALKEALLDIYDDSKDKDLFDNFNAPTVLGVYIYTSKEILESDKSAWIGMLTKGPLDSEPRISFNELKLTSLQGQNDDLKSEDEIALDKLNGYLKDKGLELCSFYKQLGDMELESIHKADAKFPNYDYPSHGDYVGKLIKEEREKLSSKYDLADSIYLQVSVFGMSYCK